MSYNEQHPPASAPPAQGYPPMDVYPSPGYVHGYPQPAYPHQLSQNQVTYVQPPPLFYSQHQPPPPLPLSYIETTRCLTALLCCCLALRVH